VHESNVLHEIEGIVIAIFQKTRKTTAK